MHWLRLCALNAFIATIVLVVAIDTLPQSPAALHRAIAPTLVRLGINQGAWNLFAPEPDHVNTRLRAEVAYRDGQRREWRGPDWRNASAWEKWVGHRHVEWFDHIILHKGAHIMEAWSRQLARAARPELADADRGAEVRVIYQEAVIPSAEKRPWKSFHQPTPFDDGWVLNIEKLE